MKNESRKVHMDTSKGKGNQWKLSAIGRNGIRATISCPFHAEKTPSCLCLGNSHDEEPAVFNGGWHCLGCGRFGEWKASDYSDFDVGESGISAPNTIVLTETLTETVKPL